MTVEWQVKALTFINEKTKVNRERIGEKFPHAVKEGSYDQESPQWWTAGFWPGILWQVYCSTKEPELAAMATRLEHDMDYLLGDPNKVDHDLGFMWTLTSLARYLITGDEGAKTTALLAGNLLLARYNSAGHYLKAWNNWSGTSDNSGIVIIDSMMNLGLLYWASEATGDPRFAVAATAHAHTILDEFIRADGSVVQMVNFNATTGAVIEKRGGQGFSATSSWSRGCGWAIYGFAIAYHYTGEACLLDAAKKVCQYFALQMGAEPLPQWDFRIPADTKTVTYHYPDSSAAAIAACGALFIADCVPAVEKAAYYKFGEKLTRQLFEYAASTKEASNPALLNFGTSHWPEQENLNTGLIYGDYFFAEAVNVLNGHDNRFWLGVSQVTRTES